MSTSTPSAYVNGGQHSEHSLFPLSTTSQDNEFSYHQWTEAKSESFSPPSMCDLLISTTRPSTPRAIPSPPYSIYKSEELDQLSSEFHPDISKCSVPTTPELVFYDSPSTDSEELGFSLDRPWNLSEHCPTVYDMETYPQHMFLPPPDVDSGHRLRLHGIDTYRANVDEPLPNFGYLPGVDGLRYRPQHAASLSPSSSKRGRHVPYSDYSDHMPRISSSRSAPVSPRRQSPVHLPSPPMHRPLSTQPSLQRDFIHISGQTSYTGVIYPQSRTTFLLPPDSSQGATSRVRSEEAQIAPISSWIDESTVQTSRRRPKKQVLSCLFCRERKIACGRPEPGSDSPVCSQCKRRGHECIYPTESRRGQHKRVRKTEHLVADAA